MKVKMETAVTVVSVLVILGVYLFLAVNPLVFKYLLAMVGGSVQAGHL